MKKLLVLFLLTVAGDVFAQQKYALVIGNGNYANITRLNNPVNDANDMETALRGLGFTVEKVLNGNLAQMETGIINLKNRLKSSKNSYGFFFYAGHGVQSNGENYLIPVDANIQSESFLRRQSIAVQEMLDELNDAGNELNVVVLDACRDNPFSWRRSGSRGLQVVGNQPADSIIVFATSAGSVAADGTGRNGLFTSHLLNNLKKPGLEVFEIFRLTMADVSRASGNQQRPAVYSQFSGIAYLGQRPSPNTPVQPPAPVSVYGSVRIDSDIAGEILINGKETGKRIKEGGTETVSNVSTGSTEVAVKGDDGKITKAQNNVMVYGGQTVPAEIKRPRVQRQPLIQIGIATQEMTDLGLTAGHAALQLGTKARIKNMANGKEVIVTIYRRIVPSSTRVIDLSPEAARAIDMGFGGTVEITQIIEN